MGDLTGPESVGCLEVLLSPVRWTLQIGTEDGFTITCSVSVPGLRSMVPEPGESSTTAQRVSVTPNHGEQCADHSHRSTPSLHRHCIAVLHSVPLIGPFVTPGRRDVAAIGHVWADLPQ